MTSSSVTSHGQLVRPGAGWQGLRGELADVIGDLLDRAAQQRTGDQSAEDGEAA